jgi:hypothetical protein
MILDQIDADTFKTKARGCEFTITRRPDGWRVMVINAATRAWRSLGTKDFPTLEEVEKHYKSLRGIAALIAAEAHAIAAPGQLH